jgi:hypothetical protein
MTVAERIPHLDDAELANLHANALRMQGDDGRRGEQATALIPLIEAELAERVAKKPPRAPARARKKSA